MLKTLAVSLALTLALEGVFALIWGVKSRRDWFLLLAVNAVTNPIVVGLYHYGGGGVPLTAALEASAVLAEWLVYRKWGQSTHPAFLFSLCANCFSYFCGLILNMVFGSLLGGM